MKKLLCIIIVTALFSCKKESKQYCFTCNITGINGYQRVLDTCSDVDSKYYRFEDANHNDLAFHCNPK